VKGST